MLNLKPVTSVSVTLEATITGSLSLVSGSSVSLILKKAGTGILKFGAADTTISAALYPFVSGGGDLLITEW